MLRVTVLSCFNVRTLRDGPILSRAHGAGISGQVSQGDQNVTKESTFLNCGIIFNWQVLFRICHAGFRKLLLLDSCSSAAVGELTESTRRVRNLMLRVHVG